MTKQSAGLLMYRQTEGKLEVFLVHPGGPFWAKKDRGAWTIPKGEYDRAEAPLDAAVREFQEETGFKPEGPFLELGTVKQAGRKAVSAWAFEGDCNADAMVSNVFEMEWPPRSGRTAEFAEVDRGRWFSLSDGQDYVLKSQVRLLGLLSAALDAQVASGKF